MTAPRAGSSAASSSSRRGRGSHVSLAIGLPSGFSDQTPRIHKLLNRAYQQFMPKAMNVILMCSRDPADVGDFQTALLGSHVERWDAVPPRGRRIAHGRAEDGFWYGGRFAESVVAGWFDFDPSAPGEAELPHVAAAGGGHRTADAGAAG